jgi:hypothetical protein
MTCWRQNEREEARQWFDHALAWIRKSGSEDAELRRFHTEAAALLGLPGPGPVTAAPPKPKADPAAKDGRL